MFPCASAVPRSAAEKHSTDSIQMSNMRPLRPNTATSLRLCSIRRCVYPTNLQNSSTRFDYGTQLAVTESHAQTRLRSPNALRQFNGCVVFALRSTVVPYLTVVSHQHALRLSGHSSLSISLLFPFSSFCHLYNI